MQMMFEKINELENVLSDKVVNMFNILSWVEPGGNLALQIEDLMEKRHRYTESMLVLDDENSVDAIHDKRDELDHILSKIIDMVNTIVINKSMEILRMAECDDTIEGYIRLCMVWYVDKSLRDRSIPSRRKDAKLNFVGCKVELENDLCDDELILHLIQHETKDIAI